MPPGLASYLVIVVPPERWGGLPPVLRPKTYKPKPPEPPPEMELVPIVGSTPQWRPKKR